MNLKDYYHSFNINIFHLNEVVRQKEKSGIKSIRWNGKNTKSQSVGSGMYLYRIQAGTFNQTKKLVLIK